ncbi:MAG: hypothetical protein QOD75_1173 [Blastocatellia bacterium]|nr:hypothetical protein [Blastocatellia bacterium]
MQGQIYFRAFLLSALGLSLCLVTRNTIAQKPGDEGLKPDLHRALVSRAGTTGIARKQGHQPLRRENSSQLRPRNFTGVPSRVPSAAGFSVLALSAEPQHPESLPLIAAGTPLSRVLHTAQLTSLSGTDEEYVDRNNDLVADERTTFDSAGGFFDVALGQSGARYGVFSGTVNNSPVGALVVAVDTNGNYKSDAESTYNLKQFFDLPSAAAVVTGVSTAGREFVVVCSSGYYNSANPNDPYNEPSPGVILLVRDSSATGFDDTRSRKLVTVGDNKLYNANALALLPNNDLLIADFASDELRIVRDTDGDAIPDTLDATPYYSYRFSDDAPLEVAVNSRGVVFSHSSGNDTLMLALFDDNHDGRADRDEVVIEGLSIDNNLFLHGLTVDRIGNIYVIEDASGAADSSAQGGNGGAPRIDAFPDPNLTGFPYDGAIFARTDDPGSQFLTGLSFGGVPANPINESRFFVRRHYLDFLSREPDDGGWNYWTNEITLCGHDPVCINSRRIGVSGSFFIEQEFQDTGSFIYRFFRASYGRRPTFTEFVAERAKVIGGSNLETSKQTFANDWVARAAFQQVYPLTQTPSQFVNKLFDTASLMPFAAQRQQLTTDMQGGKTRAQVLREVIEIAEFKTREYNPSFVTMEYFGYLKRDPEPDGYDFWLNVLNNREPNNYRGMICSFITSREYQERFGLSLARTNADCGQ